MVLDLRTLATAKASVTKIRNSSRSHAHKIHKQAMEQSKQEKWVKLAGFRVFRKYINTMKKKTKEMNEEKNGK